MSAPAPAAVEASPTPAPSPSSYEPIDALPPPPRLFVPIPKAEGSLPPGTRVNRGQPLMTPTESSHAFPLAPAAGTVVGVTEVDRVGIGRTAALEIAVDPAATDEREVDQTIAPPADLPGLIDQLRRGGVQADRHTSPNLLAQLLDARQRKIDTVLCNLLDPAGESDLMATVTRTGGDAILAGLAAIAKATGAARLWLAADTRAHGAAQSALRKAGASAPRTRVFEIANDYPQADPSLLLYALLSRRLRPGRLPSEVGTILLDGPAAVAVGRCVTAGRAMLQVPVEVRESDREACSVRSVPVGTPLGYLLEQLWLRPERLTLRAGAALRDVRIRADAIIDGAGEISIDAGPLSPVINPDPCIRCGWCVEACPVRIHPAGLLEAAQDHDYPAAQWYGLETCIECGICSYVCPSRLPLLPAIRDLRAAMARRGNGK